MITQGITQEAFTSLMEVRLGTNYTDEQHELINGFGEAPTFCFASPGTGKTYTAIGGLLNAELFKQIPGDNIYALSFTRLATAELAVRHDKACKALGCTRRVTFKTLHALCQEILKENYRLLNMQSYSTADAMTMEDSCRLIESTCEEWHLTINRQQIPSVVRACRTLNNALIFDPDTVATKMAFKECRMDYDTFERIRGLLFSYSLLSESISVSDMLLYTVMLLQRHPEVSANFKKKCRVMLVDEAQDLSLLQLRIISLLTDCPILIGDMKQQIYGFNGACQEIVHEFRRLYPNAVDMQLTQSFRCKNEIAEFATKIILPNKIGGEDYKGVGEGGTVMSLNGLYDTGVDIKSVVRRLKEDFLTHNRQLSVDYLFLTRNNISVIPVIEELYQNELPFRVNKFQKATAIPVIQQMVAIVLFAQNSKSLGYLDALKYLIPEFQGYRSVFENPLYQICTETGKSPLEINYQYKDPRSAGDAMNVIITVQELLEQNAPVSKIFDAIYPTFNEAWLNKNKWWMESTPDYYLNSVAPLLYKTFKQFFQDEEEKYKVALEGERYNRGVRCYTMHASKGLEADVVYILDADEGLIPNVSKLDKMIKADCLVDAARQVREERSLCYVACTRAKSELYIVHNGKESPIFHGGHEFDHLDVMYDAYRSAGDDIRAFTAFTNTYVPE